MRIGIDARAADAIGGIGRYTRDLITALARFSTQHTYTVFVYQSQDTAWLPPSMHVIRVQKLWKKCLPVFWEHVVFARIMARQRLDLVHFPHLNAPLGYREPFVVTAHDLSIYTHPEWFPAGQWLSTKFVVPSSVRRARKIFSVSGDVEGAVQATFRIDTSRQQVIPNGIDQRLFTPTPTPTRDYLLYVGTAAPYKNVPFLNDIVERIGMRCVVVGATSQDFHKVMPNTPVSRHLVFLGQLPFNSPALVQLYQHALCLLQPSLYESFALPILEALACGTPVLAADLPSLRAVYGDRIEYVAGANPALWVTQVHNHQRQPKHVASTEQSAIVQAYAWERLVPMLEHAYTTARP